jgi:hypothetical protein
MKSREQGIGNREQGAGNREQGKLVAGDVVHAFIVRAGRLIICTGLLFTNKDR